MSEEQLKAFIAKVQADTSLQEQLKVEGADVVAIAKAAGFSINTQDLEADSENLSDEELEGVAGGDCWLLWTNAEPRRGALSVYRRRPC
ncbi:MAG: Nif11-like leader peptide family natural product precursor [Prochlorococcus sp.]